MRTLLLFLVVLTVLVQACRDSASPTVDNLVDTTYNQNEVTVDTQGPDTLPHMDTTQLIVDSLGNVKLNHQAINKKEKSIYRALYNHWLLAYSELRHLPVAITITYQGTVTMGIRDNLKDAIGKAQENMKNYIARDRYKKSYSALDAGRQTEIQQQHAILFQKDFE